MTGNFETGLLIYQEAIRRYAERDQIYHATYLGNLGHVYWMEANLTVLHQTAESLLDLIKKHVQPAAVSYGLYLLGIVHYQRNELQYAEEKLVEVLETYHAASPMNFAHSAFALALTYQAQGKPDQAREICNSVVADALETNNEDMQQVARAFEAELALRQGFLAEASHWLGKYHPKPFRPAFRFYMPQITAAKILLAQETAESRRRAALLLEQLHDFLVSIHNNRFRIDVLALQALLFDSQGNESAALKTLEEALKIAEPSRFIRVFVDLGPRMVKLLKQLVKHNVAVEYIMKILAAFTEDGQNAVPVDSDSNGPSPHRRSSASGSEFASSELVEGRIPTLPRLSSSQAAFPPERRPEWPLRAGGPISQPLVDPLTNREIDILDLLAQRLQNKEIAAKLFISSQTVKKHLNNIYRKLSVNGRRQAVEKARTLGILTRR